MQVGTIDVVVYAKEHWPGTSFALTLGKFVFGVIAPNFARIFTPSPQRLHSSGTDTFNDIKKGKWKRGRELLELVSVVVVSRPGVPYAIHEEDLVNPRCVPQCCLCIWCID